MAEIKKVPRERAYEQARAAIKELDESWVYLFIEKYDGDESVCNLFELDSRIARIARVDFLQILPATIYVARLALHHPQELSDIENTLLENDRLQASLEVRDNCYRYVRNHLNM